MSEYLESISIEFIAAFLGFLFALLLDNILDKRTERKQTEIVINGLTDELNDIISGLSEMIEQNIILDAPLSTPTWNASQNSGETIRLMKHAFYNDLITTYSRIESLNFYLVNKRFVDRFQYMKDILELAKKVVAQINTEVSDKRQ